MMLGFSTGQLDALLCPRIRRGVFLSFVPYQPMAFLGRIDAVAAFFGMILVSIYMRSYEQWAWRRMLVRIRRWRNSVAGAYALDDDRARRPLLSP
jgi:hypothetical protein